jgi:hypothetical protein
MNFNHRIAALLLGPAIALSLAACGGGGGSTAATTPGATASVSTGAITAFGSVFVNGHEFNTSGANIVDDDTGAMLRSSDLEVGMVVTVNSAAGSTTSMPVAADIHVSPLARGFVDASDVAASTITVMGQTVQLTSGTVFTDHRACLTATTGACTAIAGQADLVPTAGSMPGNFVTVHGYLLSSGGSAQIVATLVSAQDYVANTSLFKVEGVATASAGTLTIGAETLDLSTAVCHAGGAVVACSSAFKTGDTVAAIGTVPPAANVFVPSKARLSRLLPQAAGATVEVEGQVSSVSGMFFVVRGISVDGSALTTLPAVGDRVELLGTVAADGKSVVATTMEHDIAAAAPRVILAGPLTLPVTAGSAAGTFNVSVLGQTAVVDATTRIADRTVMPPTTFNSGNFDTYVNAKPSAYVVVRTMVVNGALHATGFDIVNAPAGGMVAVAGPADAAPTASGATSTVTIHGVSVIYDPLKIIPMGNRNIVAGSYLLAAGTLSSGSVDTTAAGGFLFVLPNTARDRGFRGF